MSGIVQNNILRSSGTIAVTAAGLSWDTAVVTGSTVTVEAGNGYWINTTSNTCTITLPSSAESGDQIVLIDYARTWSTNKIIIDSNGLNFQGNDDTYTVEYTTDGQSVNIVYSDATKGWIPLEDDVTADVPVAPPTQKGIFGFGYLGSYTGVTNLVSSSGVVATDTTAVGTARSATAAATYGGDKAIFGFGNAAGLYSLTNLVSNSGVVASDTTGVGTARYSLAATGYGLSGQAIFCFGLASSPASGVNTRNLVNSSGVVATDAAGAGTARSSKAARYGSTGQAIVCYGYLTGSEVYTAVTNLISNTGVVASDTAGVGTARECAVSSYGGDKAISAFGYAAGRINTRNLISNTGVVGSTVSGAGTAQNVRASTNYGGDKAIFAYGFNGSANTSISNLVSNLGVVASDTTGVGTARQSPSAAGYSTSA